MLDGWQFIPMAIFEHLQEGNSDEKAQVISPYSSSSSSSLVVPHLI